MSDQFRTREAERARVEPLASATVAEVLARIDTRLARIEAALADRDAPADPLVVALHDHFGTAPFTAAEAMAAGARQTAAAALLGRAAEGLAGALAAARISTAGGFGRWAARAAGMERAGAERGTTIWVVGMKPHETPKPIGPRA